MSVYIVSGGIVLAHFVYKYNTTITNYIKTKLIDQRVNNLHARMIELHKIIDTLEEHLIEKEAEYEILGKKNQELQSELLQLNDKLADFIDTNYEFTDKL
jgi:predicted nuclease with TOPRIM domain